MSRFERATEYPNPRMIEGRKSEIPLTDRVYQSPLKQKYAGLTRANDRPVKQYVKPNLPVSNGHHDMADLEMFLLPNRGGVIFWDKKILVIACSKRIRLALLVHITYFFSCGVKNLAVEGKSTITVCEGYQIRRGAWSRTFIPKKARIPTQTVMHPSRIYIWSERFCCKCPIRTHKDPGPS